MNTLDTSTAGPSGLADLKRAHRSTWASGSYATVAERLIEAVPPPHLLERTAIQPGTELLDVATGTGNLALPAARLGARVTGLDLTPALLERAAERADAEALDVEWVEGDAEDLPFEDDRFDCVLSIFGVQFAPRHEYAARELVRVTRPGGTIGLINWTPRGHLGQVLKAVGKRMPAPPAYASAPPLWGDRVYVEGLLTMAGAEDPEFELGINPIVGFADAAEWVDFMADNYGPLLKARERLAPEGYWEELREELVEMTASADRGERGELRIEAEYLLVLVRTPGG